MMKDYIKSILIALFLFPFSAISDDIVFPIDTLSIVASNGNVNLTIEVATSDKQHERGLMYRKSMQQDHGMLFTLAKPRHVDMWMKNTLIPLDMIFIDNKGVITEIMKNTTPESTNIISSRSNNIRAVLEINGGAADSYHISEGDRVVYALFEMSSK